MFRSSIIRSAGENVENMRQVGYEEYVYLVMFTTF